MVRNCRQFHSKKMNNKSFMMFVSSTDCSDIFPSNNIANFKIRLNRSLNLDQDWNVSLTEVSYPNTMYTFDKIETLQLTTSFGVLDGFSLSLTVEPNLYDSLENLVDEINTVISRNVQIEKSPSIRITNESEVIVEQGRYKNELGSWPVLLSFSETLHNILGIDRWGRASMKFKHSNLYVYCNIVSNRHVGDAYVPLLRQFSVSNSIEYGVPVSCIFKRLHHCKLSQNIIREIEFQILDDTGSEPSFKFGYITLTLKFSRNEIQ